MRFDREYKPELCSTRDPSRSSLQDVELDVEAKKLVAIDGHCCAVIPCSVEPSEKSGRITAAMLKAARKKAKAERLAEAAIETNCETASTGELKFPREERTVPFPDWRLVVPKSRPATISLNIKLLSRIAEAIGAKDGVVALSIDQEEDPILVYNIGKRNRQLEVLNNHEEDAFGVLMPCRFQNKVES